MSSSGYHLIQLLLGGGVALLSLAGRLAVWPQRRLLTMIFSLAGCWMVLCGPASESCTYILLAPILAWAALEAAMDHRPLWSRCIPWCSFVLFVFSQTISWFPEQVRMLFLGILPLAGIVLWAGLVESSIRNLCQTSRAVGWVQSSKPTAATKPHYSKNVGRVARPESSKGVASLQGLHALRKASGRATQQPTN